MTTSTEDQTAQLKAEAIAARRAARPAWRNAHVDRVIREREARESAREYRRASRTKHCNGCDQDLPLEAFGIHKRQGLQSRCKPCASAAARVSYYRKQGRSCTGSARGTVSDERRLEAAKRVAHLSGILKGTNADEHIDSEERWNTATAELQELWLVSGDKECVSCKAVVPPTEMRAPGPANFYPNQCRSCATKSYEANCIRVFGKLSEPRLIPMRDGTSITIGELARRHREREITHGAK